MDYGLSTADNRLLTELGDWNRLEAMFQSTFGDESLKDKYFRKMKLATYERLYDRYKDDLELSKDERALVVMLRFQCTKIRKILYPKPVSRLLYRIRNFFALSFAKMFNRRTAYDYNSEAFASSNLPFEGLFTKGEQASQEPAVEKRMEQKPRVGPDLGQRNSYENGQGKGHSV
ncbi:MAG: hypothetical protein ACN6O7_00645 [Sphingobacterium sp.]